MGKVTFIDTRESGLRIVGPARASVRLGLGGLGLIVAVLALMAGGIAPAFAEVGGPHWTVTAVARPTNFTAGEEDGGDEYVVAVTNTGDAPSREGEPVVITDEFPAGVSGAAGASGEDELAVVDGLPGAKFGKDCGLTGSGFVSCLYPGVVQPDDTLIVDFPVDVAAHPPVGCEGGAPAGAVSCVVNTVRVSGGGALGAAVQTPTDVYESNAKAQAATSFGLARGGASTALSSSQAGAHPDLITSGAFNTVNERGATAQSLKDITDDLPPGFAGDLVDTPVCAPAVFRELACPVATQVGVITITLSETSELAGAHLEPVYNLSPDPGAVAKLGFAIGTDFAYEGDVSVRPEDYGLKTTFFNATAGPVDVDNFALTVWGVPTSPVHNPLRLEHVRWGAPPPSGVSAPFFTNPTTCGSEPLEAELSADSWEQPTLEAARTPTKMALGPLTGCDRLTLQPNLTAEVTSDSAYAATGFNLATAIPQTYDEPGGLATSALKKESVTLPEGITLNPSSGAGLAACSEAQYAEEGVSSKTAQENGEGRGCPNSSKLASVKIVTPSLSEEATGSVYLAEPAPRGEAGKNPFDSLLALYLIARIPDRGVLVKAPGQVTLNQVTGQIVTTFDDLPQLPFSLATFAFNQGANAPLVTPPSCGVYTVTAELTPWSNPAGAALAPPIPGFPITASCPAGGVPTFAPQAIAGTQNNAAGDYSPLYLRLVRNDGEQEITGFGAQLPAGLTGNLSGVEQCSEAQIALARAKSGVEEEASPSCPAGSEIGHSIAEAGVGGVLAQAPGKIYLGGPFEGAPFSVVSVTSAHVGPFDLGTVVVHLPLDIDPLTARVSIPSGQADQIPHIIKGIVIHVRDIRAYIDRHDFMINPTNCTPASLTATVIGGGADPTNPADEDPVTVSDPFQAADCASLKFEPKFAVSTSGKTSRADGASLSVRLTYPSGALGHDANIKQVKVELPKQLPSRLTTLQKACTAAQFKANPAGCPAASVIGHAKAITPILPVPLEGPAYFVSNGGEAFPNLIMVLQGSGVTIDLVGDTFISNKTGITSSTFKAVPDQPVSSFELNLAQGPYSALTANGNLCALKKTVTVKKKITVKAKGHRKTITRKVKETRPSSLQIPTEFVAQNGAVIHQRTTVSVTGCPKAKQRRASAHSKGAHARR
jgi:hypothetical protein